MWVSASGKRAVGMHKNTQPFKDHEAVLPVAVAGIDKIAAKFLRAYQIT
jgi:hypothetical protein